MGSSTATCVADLAHGRSGDKGDTCNVGLVAYDAECYTLLREQVTAERVAEHFGDLVRGTVTRYEMPNIHALNFVLTRALDGGGTMSLRSDHLGKVMYTWLLRMSIHAPNVESRRPEPQWVGRSNRDR